VSVTLYLRKVIEVIIMMNTLGIVDCLIISRSVLCRRYLQDSHTREFNS